MLASYKLFWKNYFNFKGTASKKEYWWSFLANLIVWGIIAILLTVIGQYTDSATGGKVLSAISLTVMAVLGLGTLSCSVRRLRDGGYPWYYLLLALVPVFGAILVLVYLADNQGANCKKKGHKWEWKKDRCQNVCANCGMTQEKHDYDGCTCRVCGKRQDINHRFTQYDRAKCQETCEICGKTRPRHDWNHCVCRVCGEKRDSNHDFKRLPGVCREKCSVCGKEQNASHKFDVNGVCTVCGFRDPKPFTLKDMTQNELDALRFACDIMGKLDSMSRENRNTYKRLSGSLGKNTKLDAGELALVAVAASQVGQALSSDKNVTNFSNNNLNALAMRLHLINLMGATNKIKTMLDNLSKVKASEEKKVFVKKPLSAFPSYDESYQGYVKGGVCDVCNRPLDGVKAYAVDNKTFYDSPEYFEHLKAFQKQVFGLELTRAEYEKRRKMDTSPGSAVCENCIHLFADMAGVVSTDAKGEKKYYEASNLGSRHDTCDQAMGYWLGERPNKAVKPPFTLFSMPSQESGEEALLELPFIHRASDTGKLICDRIMTYGVYEVTENKQPTGTYEALVCGSDLSEAEFEAAEAALEKHGGKRKNALKPEGEVKPVLVENGDPQLVQFKEKLDKGNAAYVVHTAPTKADALAFLQKKKVNKPSFYLVVDTPEGNLGRDINGIYEE
jgi:uncharacterized membrane protein YhaH (DUF805 family)